MTLFTNSRGQVRLAAQQLRRIRRAASTPAALVALIHDTIGDAEETFLNDYDALAGTAGAETAAIAARDEADATFEGETRVTLAVLRARHGAAAVEALRAAIGGRPLHKVFDEPAGAQVAIFDRAFAVLEGRADLTLPAELLDTLKALNDALRAAVIAAERATADRAVKGLQVAASERAFVTRYRRLLRLGALTLGEEGMLAHFPQFERRRAAGKGSGG